FAEPVSSGMAGGGARGADGAGEHTGMAGGGARGADGAGEHTGMAGGGARGADGAGEHTGMAGGGARGADGAGEHSETLRGWPSFPEELPGFDPADVPAHPHELFLDWLREAGEHVL